MVVLVKGQFVDAFLIPQTVGGESILWVPVVGSACLPVVELKGTVDVVQQKRQCATTDLTVVVGFAKPLRRYSV